MVKYISCVTSFSLIPGAANYTDIDHYERRKVFQNQLSTELHQQSTEDDGEERPSSFKKLLSTFAASTSAHGVGNIAAAPSLPRRVLWLAVTVGLYSVLLVMCVALVIRYVDKPVVSRLEMSFEEVRKLNFLKLHLIFD